MSRRQKPLPDSATARLHPAIRAGGAAPVIYEYLKERSQGDNPDNWWIKATELVKLTNTGTRQIQRLVAKMRAEGIEIEGGQQGYRLLKSNSAVGKALRQ
ncbi:hypothetical protein [Lyngbya aestuarii]|uniref:hypothetical protein n=1 Tax=Lyngbya aestuarii TaxID=118322 RepID=UPI00403DEFBC